MPNVHAGYALRTITVCEEQRLIQIQQDLGLAVSFFDSSHLSELRLRGTVWNKPSSHVMQTVTPGHKLRDISYASVIILHREKCESKSHKHHASAGSTRKHTNAKCCMFD